MLINLPEDTRDVKDAIRQVFKGKNRTSGTSNCILFLQGTLLEPLLNCREIWAGK
jgi:hypothetical protein